jgi:mRNA-degrading endonuclease RelE of RelBE toxin-antitoxin system
MNFEHTPEFKKDLKKLAKRWRSLPQDVVDAEWAITPLYIEQEGVDIAVYRKSLLGMKRATILHQTDRYEVVKMRLDVAALGRSDKVRIVFVAIKTKSTIVFIELYSKNEKDREDTKRIKKYLPD